MSTDTQQASAIAADERFRVELDASGTIHVMMQGFWEKATAEAYVAQFRASVALCRRRFGKVKLLTDARAMQIQTQEIATLITTDDLYVRGDSVAVTVATVLVKVAARRHMATFPEGVQYESFISVDDAQDWLKVR